MAVKIPERQPFREKDLRTLVAIYKRAGRNIMQGFDDATDFSQFRREQLLAEIDAILRRAGEDTGAWLDEVMPETYQRGSGTAIAQLRAIGAPVKAANPFSVVDTRSVEVLISDTQRAFAESLTTVGRTARNTLSQAVKDQIKLELAEGRIVGDTRLQVARRIKAQIKAQGITGFVDRRGAQWQLDRYAEMLAKTKMMEARNTGMANKMIENGYDLVEVTGGGSKHEACRRHENEVVSLTGNTPGFKTLDQITADGIFHPNCQHHYNVVHKNLALLTKAYDPSSKEYVQPFVGNIPGGGQLQNA